VFGEFNYMDLGTRNVNFVQAPGTAGVNYKFNCPPPVVAKY
jgi:hypothetical protein